MKIKWVRYNRKRIFLCLFLFLILLGLSFGYALINSNLSIDGIANIKDAKWNIYFDEFTPLSGSVIPRKDVIIDNTTITFNAKLENPSDFYGFEVDVVNGGTIDAMIDSINISPDINLDYLTYTVTYDDDSQISEGDILEAGETKTIKVNLSYVDGLEQEVYPNLNKTYNISIQLNYVQYSE